MQSNAILYYGGRIYTFESTQPYAQALAIQDGIIVAVGSEQACRAALKRPYEEVNLKRGVLMPGFHDCHMHAIPTVYYTMNANLYGAKDIDELIQKLSITAAETANDPDSWIIGCNFDEQSLITKRMPTRHELDHVSTKRALIVFKHDGHSVIVNSRAMELAGITAATLVPEGGIIERDEQGLPLGIFREHATHLILDHMGMPSMEAFISGTKKTFNGLLAHGITSLGLILQCDQEGPGGSLGVFDIPLMELLRPYIPQSLYGLVLAKDLDSMHKLKDSPMNSAVQRTKLGGVKIIADGTFGSCTAAMEEPFCDYAPNAGMMLYDEQTLYTMMTWAHKAGYQLAIHAIGDKTNRVCIELYTKLLRDYPRANHRHRIEHASILTNEMLSSIKNLGLNLCMQPMFIHSDMPYLEKRIGRERMHHTYPFRSILNRNIPLAGASDAPIETQSVLAAVQCAVTREGYVPEESISVHEALSMYTIQAAHAQFEEKIKGSIIPGKRADLVILEDDPQRVNPEEIHTIPVRATIIGGEMLYSS